MAHRADDGGLPVHEVCTQCSRGAATSAVVAGILKWMRPIVRLVACALVAVFMGTPVWVAACDINCEAASRQTGPSLSSRQTAALPAAAPASTTTAHHHHHQPDAAPAASAVAPNRSSVRVGAVADACDGAGLVVSAVTAPSATRVWNVQLAPAPVVSAFALTCVGSPAPSDARCALPRPDRPLATILRI